MRFFQEHPRIRIVLLAAMALALLGLSMYRSYSLGQYRTMYDNPIYRWRESIAVALSEMSEEPLNGYVAYRSIRDYLNLHGLALMEGEATHLPTPAEREAVVYDPDRLEKLFREAAAVPIDYSLPPVPIVGNEKGEAEFYYFAFSLFGINLAAMWKFYFLLLFCSAAAFFVIFRSSQFCMSLLLVYLIVHYALVGLASGPWLQTVHNSRFFPVLALLPTMHLLLLLIRGDQISWASGAFAVAQAFLLFFLIFCRVQAMWQPVAVMAVGVLTAPLRPLWVARRHPQLLRQAMVGGLVAVWPASFVAAGTIGLVLYEHVALDRHVYAAETKTHTIWEPLFSGTISASPELCKLYCFGEEPYSDTMSYVAVLNYLRSRNDSSPSIAYLEGNTIRINAMANMGVYDHLVQKIYLDIVRQHPWLVLKSFLYDKLSDQVEILGRGGVISRTGIAMPLLLALGVGLVILLTGTPYMSRNRILIAIRAVLIFVLLSLATTEIIPNIMIFDTIAVFGTIILLGTAAIPLALAAPLRRALGRLPNKQAVAGATTKEGVIASSRRRVK